MRLGVECDDDHHEISVAQTFECRDRPKYLYHGSMEDMRNKCLSRNFSLTRGSTELEGKSTRSSTRMRDFFLLGVVNSRLYS
jgi:hypothetical protein